MVQTTRGILVIPNLEKGKGKSNEETAGVLQIRYYDLVIGTYTKGMHAKGIFPISSPIVREIIAHYRFKDGHRVGFTSIDINSFKQANMNFYHPTLYEPVFQAKGIADHLDLLLEKQFAKEFPEHKLYITREASAPRIMQWIKRGRKLNEGYTFHEAWKQTREKVIQNTRKNRPPARRNH